MFQRHFFRFLLITGILLLVGGPGCLAQAPLLLDYQGDLRDSSGVPYSDGDYTMEFCLYDAASGGNLVWTETRSATTSQVALNDGLFSVKLGSENALTSSLFAGGGPLYLEIRVDTSDNGSFESGETFTPREQLTSSAFALESDLLDGQEGSYYRDAANLNAGTLSTDRYSAYADLEDESKIGSSSTLVTSANAGSYAVTAAGAGNGLTGGGGPGSVTLNVGAGTGISVAADAVSVDYGSSAGTACEGNDSRLSDARTPTGSAGGDLSGTYPNPSVQDDSHTHDTRYYTETESDTNFVDASGDTITGNLAVNGNTTLGDATTDTATVNAALTTSKLNDVIVVDGTNYTTIQAAINALPSTGGKVFIPEGTYDLGSTGITLPDDDIILEGAGASTVLTTSSGSVDYISAEYKSNCVVRDMAFHGDIFSVSQQIGVNFKYCTDVRIEGCYFDTMHVGSRIYSATSEDFARRNIVTNCHYLDCVVSVHLFSAAVNGYGVNRVDSSIVSNCVIDLKNLDSSSEYCYGIAFGSSTRNCTVEGNTIRGGDAGMLIAGYFSTITGNTIREGDTGIMLWDTDNSGWGYFTITGNIIESFVSNGILLYGAGNTVINGNIVSNVSGNNGSGINLATSGNNTVTGNLLYDYDGSETNTTAIGIGSEYTLVSNNRVNGWNTGIYVNAQRCTVTGNVLSTIDTNKAINSTSSANYSIFTNNQGNTKGFTFNGTGIVTSNNIN